MPRWNSILRIFKYLIIYHITVYLISIYKNDSEKITITINGDSTSIPDDVDHVVNKSISVLGTSKDAISGKSLSCRLITDCFF